MKKYRVSDSNSDSESSRLDCMVGVAMKNDMAQVIRSTVI